MSRMIFPGPVLRGYFLGSNDNRTAADENYYLCVGTDMRIFCLIQYSPNKPFQAASWSEPIPPEQFKNHTVEEGNVADLARKHLEAVLPEGS